MTQKIRFTPDQVVRARQALITLGVDEMLSKGFINIPAVLQHDAPLEVVITSVNERKIQVIREIRGYLSISLQEAKSIADSAETNGAGVVLITRDTTQANEAAKAIRVSGATVVIRQQVAS